MLLPDPNTNFSSEFSLFEQLVRAGEERSFVMLPLPLRLFLIHCLVEYLRDNEVLGEVLASSLLTSWKLTWAVEEKNARLKRTGDEALLLAGLFPERASRLNVSKAYFRSIGQSAYATIASNYLVTGRRERGKFYGQVARHFQLLEAVLGGARKGPDPTWEAFRRFRTGLQ